MDTEDSRDKISGVLTVSWKSVAVTSVLIALTAVVTTVVITTIKGADTLSTIALALAVIAFVVQIIVFIVQAASASQQALQSQEIYGSTLKALAAIEEKAEGTRATVSLISDRMLDVALGKALPQAVSTGVSVTSSEFSKLLADNLRDFMDNEQPPEALRTGAIQRRMRSSALVGQARPVPTPDMTMRELPDHDNLLKGLDALELLNDWGLRALYTLGEDQANNGGAKDGGFGAGLKMVSGADILHKEGLIKRVRVSWHREAVFVLNDLGKSAARVLLNLPSTQNLPEPLSTRATTIGRALERAQQRYTEAINRDPFPDIPIDD